MAISGTYYVKMWLADPKLVHADDQAEEASTESAATDDAPVTYGSGIPMPQVETKDYGKPRHGAFEGEMVFHFTPNPDGTLSGDADGTPINFGFYTGDEFFKVDFPAGPGRFEIWAQVDPAGYLTGMISVGGNKGFINFVYGKKVD